MDKRMSYRRKGVQDIHCDNSVIRIWDVAGDFDRNMIVRSFEPLMRTGFVYPYVALMPDHHPGEGSMVGSVIPTRNVLLPSVIGGDLGCGVSTVRLPVEVAELKPVLKDIHTSLHSVIPTGSAHNAMVTERVEGLSLWSQARSCEVISSRMVRKLKHQFASLGGGNHFLELQEDDYGMAWLTLHSGSRYLGVLIRDYYIEAARAQKGINDRVFRKVPYIEAGSDLAEAYLADLEFSLEFARRSRREMMLRAIASIGELVDCTEVFQVGVDDSRMIDVAHNYIERQDFFGETLFIHRKGAVKATDGRRVMIPGSMGSSSFLAEGRGNVYSFFSCSHGAGRVMSRRDAIRSISNKSYEKSMGGVFHVHDMRLKDESPMAYKDIRSVMRGQKDLVKICKELRPLLSIKGVG